MSPKAKAKKKPGEIEKIMVEAAKQPTPSHFKALLVNYDERLKALETVNKVMAKPSTSNPFVCERCVELKKQRDEAKASNSVLRAILNEIGVDITKPEEWRGKILVHPNVKYQHPCYGCKHFDTVSECALNIKRPNTLYACTRYKRR